MAVLINHAKKEIDRNLGHEDKRAAASGRWKFVEYWTFQRGSDNVILSSSRRSVREVGPVVDREGAVDDVGEEELYRRVGQHLAP